MRSLLVAAVLVGMSVSGAADTQNKQVRAKPSHSGEKGERKSGAAAKLPAAGKASGSAAAKNLRDIERESVKKRGASRTAKKPAPVKLQQKEKKGNPPINFARGGGGKGTSANRGNEKERVRQKRGRH